MTWLKFLPSTISCEFTYLSQQLLVPSTGELSHTIGLSGLTDFMGRVSSMRDGILVKDPLANAYAAKDPAISGLFSGGLGT